MGMIGFHSLVAMQRAIMSVFTLRLRDQAAGQIDDMIDVGGP